MHFFQKLTNKELIREKHNEINSMYDIAWSELCHKNMIF